MFMSHNSVKQYLDMVYTNDVLAQCRVLDKETPDKRGSLQTVCFQQTTLSDLFQPFSRLF